MQKDANLVLGTICGGVLLVIGEAFGDMLVLCGSILVYWCVFKKLLLLLVFVKLLVIRNVKI